MNTVIRIHQDQNKELVREIDHLRYIRERLEENIHTAVLIIGKFADRLDEAAKLDPLLRQQVTELLDAHEIIETRRHEKGA